MGTGHLCPVVRPTTLAGLSGKLAYCIRPRALHDGLKTVDLSLSDTRGD